MHLCHGVIFCCDKSWYRCVLLLRINHRDIFGCHKSWYSCVLLLGIKQCARMHLCILLSVITGYHQCQHWSAALLTFIKFPFNHILSGLTMGCAFNRYSLTCSWPSSMFVRFYLYVSVISSASLAGETALCNYMKKTKQFTRTCVILKDAWHSGSFECV